MEFYTLDIIDEHIADLEQEIDDLKARRGRMVAVVSDEAGGIIAYAIGEEHAALIVAGLNTNQED